MKKLNKVITLFFIVIYCCNLNCKSLEVNSFCENKYGFDYTRIPLKYPYELIRLTGQDNWGLKFLGKRENLFPKSTINIVEINIANDYAFFYCEDYYDSFYPSEKSFYGIIDINRAKEYYFDTKIEFDSTLIKLGFKTIKLFKVSDIWKKFEANGVVDWCITPNGAEMPLMAPNGAEMRTLAQK
jgi:hypothetical protein